jgi:hypothetical protein
MNELPKDPMYAEDGIWKQVTDIKYADPIDGIWSAIEFLAIELEKAKSHLGD